ncbi:MAG TPA: non-homologous end-joining DNA ligase [Bdellovibrionota bacterium]|nr:non-homologous end-joining DNA ligase [Bdellovibrionota bacterium]
MLCTLVDEPFDDPNWIFEPKLDGLRVLAEAGERRSGGRVKLVSRNGKDQTLAFPEIQSALAHAARRGFRIDGEIVCLDSHGRSSFKLLQQRMHVEDPEEIERRAREFPAVLFVFDMLQDGHEDVRLLPLEKRKARLRAALDWNDTIRFIEPLETTGKRAYRAACSRSDEGIVAKRLGSPYLGARTGDWVKIKCLSRQELVIGGYTDPQGSRVGLGAVLVGYFVGDRFVYAGKVGTGFGLETLRELKKRLSKIRTRQSPFEGNVPLRGGGAVHWVKPALVAEVAFAEWTRHGLLRQPRFEGLREDKRPQDVRRELPKPAPTRKLGASPLEEYRRKRDFRRTAEPAPRGVRRKKPEAPLSFVIQEHHASHLHYDFRLEAGGVLKSWALPKEPTTEPGAKRLAVETEDHPLEYGSFEGQIPQGEYGGGTVSIWDRGTWTPLTPGKSAEEAIASGSLKLRLEGRRLNGEYTLVRMKESGRGKSNWLLIPRLAASPGKVLTLRPRPAAAPRDLGLKNLDKTLFPGVTKGDLIEYYRRIAPRLLPELKDRPVTLERLPDGVGPGKPHFWQKNTPPQYPDWLPRARLRTEDGRHVAYALIPDVDSLLFLVNQGTVTFHVWASRMEDLDRPDFVLFDLDPGRAPFAQVVRIAKRLGEILCGEEGLDARVKTSGKTGLHVLAPWARTGDYDEARAWALEVARRIEREMPDAATTQIRKAGRAGRVYIDVMQNVRGHHAVPAFAVRAVPGATVSMPIDWSDLHEGLDPAKFTLKAVLRELRGAKPAQKKAA